MKTIIIFSCIWSILSIPSLSQSDAVRLFNGVDFTGWEGDQSFFRIVDSAIVAGSLTKPIPKNQFLCTEKSYTDFDLRLRVKFINPTRDNNGGIQFRTKRIPGHHEVVGYQADVGYTSDGLVWGGLYDESRRRKFLVPPVEHIVEIVREDKWNEYQIRCLGNQIECSINGVKILDFTESDQNITAQGVVCVQIHGGSPAEAWYKGILLRPL